MDLRPGELEIYEGHPSWRSTLLFYFVGLIASAAAGVIGAVASTTGAGVAIGIGAFVLVLVVGWLRRITTRYTITNQRLYVRKGILARHVDQTRMERLQDITTNQSIFERLIGIGSVDFDTAGAERHDDLFQFRGVADPTDIVHRVDEAMHDLQQGATQQQAAPPPEGRYATPPPPPPPPPSDGL